MTNRYYAVSGEVVTVAVRVPIATGTTIKTHLQIAMPSGFDILTSSWGCSFDASAAGVPGIVELIETDVAATVTALTPLSYNNPAGPASKCVSGAALTGHTASAEGSITATRTADVQHIAPTSQYIYQWPLGTEFRAQGSKFLRIRAKFAVSVNMICWLHWVE